MYVLDIQSIYQTEISGLSYMLRVAISIRYTDFGQVIGFNKNFQFIFTHTIQMYKSTEMEE